MFEKEVKITIGYDRVEITSTLSMTYENSDYDNFEEYYETRRDKYTRIPHRQNYRDNERDIWSNVFSII